MSTAALITRQVTIVNELGLHARSAAKIAAVAQKAVSSVWIERDGETADAASIIDMLTLACAMGTTLTIGIENPADADLLNHLVELVESGFGE
ncbi:MAG: HPr family phosphocarrier protein [Desulfobacterales bacterium]|nr:HPr family phosphocarrier protein [Desulfobacterales bacterium]